MIFLDTLPGVSGRVLENLISVDHVFQYHTCCSCCHDNSQGDHQVRFALLYHPLRASDDAEDERQGKIQHRGLIF